MGPLITLGGPWAVLALICLIVVGAVLTLALAVVIWLALDFLSGLTEQIYSAGERVRDRRRKKEGRG